MTHGIIHVLYSTVLYCLDAYCFTASIHLSVLVSMCTQKPVEEPVVDDSSSDESDFSDLDDDVEQSK